MIKFMKKEIKTVHLKAFGRVQGVGFRWSAIEKAKQLHITGWVKNDYDGSVELVALGLSDNLKKFIEVIRKSPTPYGKVIHLDINYIPNQQFNAFDVKY